MIKLKNILFESSITGQTQGSEEMGGYKGFFQLSEMDVDNVYSLLVKNDTLLYKVKAIKDVQDELKTSVWKRRITMYKRK